MEEFLTDGDLDNLLDGLDPSELGELEIDGIGDEEEMSASNRRYEEIIKKHESES